jgi:SAM-dependent methyltransferase
MQGAPEKAFYDRHYRSTATGALDVEAARAAMSTPGDRYFCVLDRLGDAGRLRAVEWGFGSISRLLALQQMFQDYTALDISAETILDNHRVDARIIGCNLNADLNLAADSFDVTIAMMVVEHLFDPFHSFKELARITKPDGLVFVNLPLVTSLKNRLRLLAGRLPMTSQHAWWEQREWDGGHLHYFTLDLVVQLAALNGLELDRTYPVGRFAAIKGLAPRLLCSELSFVFSKRKRVA